MLPIAPNMNIISDFYMYVLERESIRKKKEAGLPRPWTSIPALQQYRFTNVHRHNDRTTRLLFDEFYSKHEYASGEVILLNCATFRYFGTIEFARAVGWQEEFNPEHLLATAKRRIAAGQKVFTGAYVITNQGIRAPKEEVVINNFIADIWKAAFCIVSAVRATNSWEAAASVLRRVKGYGGTGFMAKEVLQDACLTPLLRDAEDLDTWSPCGPGARRGLNWVFKRDLNFVQKEHKFIEEMRVIHRQQGNALPKDFPHLTLHDVQFCLCEYAKLRHISAGNRGKRKYVPYSNDAPRGLM